MNAQNEFQTCQTDVSYCKFGVEALLKLLAAFEEQIGGVINNCNIEYVHKTRVISRRLRAAMPIFKTCFRKNEYKKWLGEIKNVTCLLGNARDLDVQIVFIEQYMKNLDSAEKKAGVDILLKAHKDHRKSIQSSVVDGLNELKATDVLDDLGECCEQIAKKQSNESFDPKKVLEKARWHISFRLDDFLAMEKYVHLENEILKHHEMRIFAKKLRYTMELFAPLYKNKLAQEIEKIKAVQDVLGEMHDCDVWIDYIPKFIEDTQAKNKSKKNKTANAKSDQALLNFLAFVKEKRKEHYKEFVQLWDENKKRGLSAKLRKIIDVEFAKGDPAKINQELAKPNVKLAVFSDVHANFQALERVIQDAELQGADVFVNAGDSVGFGACPNEVVELLRQKNVLSILGNYDLEVIEGKAKEKGEKNSALQFTRKELAKSCESYLYSLPRELRFKVAGKKFLVTHGSPISIEEHIFHDTPAEQLKNLAEAAQADLIIVGHSHEQFWRQSNGVDFINPGSVGRPGDGIPQTAYAIISFNPFHVELARLKYDVKGAADALRKKGLPESFSQMLLCGVSLDAILKEDQSRENSMVQDFKKTKKVIAEISKKYWPDINHYIQVNKLALKLFDGLPKLHQLGARERCWLECGAILHDIGLSKARGGHHKESAKIILNDTQMPFSSQERRIIASIARYHRKALPKQSHINVATLNRETLHKIKVLSSFLRVADSLDYTHQSIVESLNIKTDAKKVTIECLSKNRSVLEEQVFNKKKDLFEKIFAKKMVLIWKQPSKTLDK
jgi:putative phosphoesterase